MVTVTEASAINDLLTHVYGPLRDGVTVDDDRAQQAAELLAESAYRKLAAGYTARDVQARA